MHTPTPRQNKVARLIQKDMSDLLQKYARDWFPGVLISVSSVRVSPDYGLAKVYISIFPTNRSEEILERLQKANKEVRYQLGQRVKHQLRKIPEIVMYKDDSLDYLDNIDNLLKD
ncbi:MAG: 30S ribosome-binding factor RbfA [Salinivirgaceae bacterium]|jgi:ribosome-binding factor A|nr:30S ribosome-binding factor RbfA [Salinivirgaceae bacterium]